MLFAHESHCEWGDCHFHDKEEQSSGRQDDETVSEESGKLLPECFVPDELFFSSASGLLTLLLPKPQGCFCLVFLSIDNLMRSWWMKGSREDGTIYSDLKWKRLVECRCGQAAKLWFLVV